MNTMTRKLDELGRIVIPQEIRELHHLQAGDELAISSNEAGVITLTTARCRCSLCGSQENTTTLSSGGAICKPCIDKIKIL